MVDWNFQGCVDKFAVKKVSLSIAGDAGGGVKKKKNLSPLGGIDGFLFFFFSCSHSL